MAQESKKKRSRPDQIGPCGEMGRASRDDVKAAKAAYEVVKAVSSTRPIYTSPILLAYRIARYMVEQDRTTRTVSGSEVTGQPYTIGGAIVAVGMTRARWAALEAGDLDYIVMDAQARTVKPLRGGPQTLTLGQVAEEYRPYTLLLLGEQPDETDMEVAQETAKDEPFSAILGRYILIVEAQREQDLYGKGRVADIFVAKARLGWRDEVTITHRREIVSSSDARAMLKEIAALPDVEDPGDLI